jgi:hypothetical protein
LQYALAGSGVNIAVGSSNHGKGVQDRGPNLSFLSLPLRHVANGDDKVLGRRVAYVFDSVQIIGRGEGGRAWSDAVRLAGDRDLDGPLLD